MGRFILLLFISTSAFAQPDTVWTRTFFQNQPFHQVMASFESMDRGYVIAGHVFDEEVHAFNESFVLKLDSLGIEEWTIYFTEINDSVHTAVLLDAIPISGSSFVCIGTAQTDFDDGDGFIARFSLQGELLWWRSFGSGVTESNDVIETTDGNLIVSSIDYNEESHQRAVSLAEFSLAGEQLWYRFYTEPNGYSSFAPTSRLCEYHEGGYLAAITSSYDYQEVSNHIWIIRTDQSGNEVTTYRIACSEEFYTLTDIVNTNDENYILAGRCSGAPFVLKLNNSLQVVWEHTYNPFWFGEYLGRMIPTVDGGVVYGGYLEFSPQIPNSAPMIARLSSSGDSVWTRYFTNIPNPLSPAMIGTSGNGGLITAMTADWPASDNTYISVVLFDSYTSLSNAAGATMNPSRLQIVQAFPNPFNSAITIEFDIPNGARDVGINIYNTLGQLVASEHLPALGTHIKYNWQPEHTPNGLYFVNVSADNSNGIRKVVLLK